LGRRFTAIRPTQFDTAIWWAVHIAFFTLSAISAIFISLTNLYRSALTKNTILADDPEMVMM
jgi:hypothetical protein